MVTISEVSISIWLEKNNKEVMIDIFNNDDSFLDIKGARI